MGTLKDHPAISVIIAAYNAGDYLKRCLKSVCSQTFSDLEIIVVNDGSTDQTGKIIDYFAKKDARVKAVHQKNQGAGLAKNTGLKLATGDYISFVDADDWIEKTTYEELYPHIQTGSIDMVVYNHNKIFPHKVQKNVRKIKEETISLKEIGIEKYILRYMISFTHEYSAWNKLVKRDVIQKYNIGFSDNKKTVYDDNLYCLKLICHINTIRTVNRAFYNYNIHEGSVSDVNNTYEKIALGYTNMLEEFRQYTNEIGVWKDWEKVYPLLYYSMVFFGLTRIKRFGGLSIEGVGKKLSQTEHYLEYMEQMNKLSVRMRYITQTLPGIGTIRNWQLSGLLFLTLLQGKLIASNALKNNDKKVEKWI